jgi:hypothetical protein
MPLSLKRGDAITQQVKIQAQEGKKKTVPEHGIRD